MNTTRSLKSFAQDHPLVTLCWAGYVALLLFTNPILTNGTVSIWKVVVPLIPALFSIGLLAWFGWLREAGFRSPAHWRDLYVLWPAVLVTLITLIPVALELPHITNWGLAAFAVLVALTAGLNEEAMFRGLILQVLRPYGLLSSAALSAFFFSILHLNNLFHLPIGIVLPQVVYAFLFGFAFAAFRLRTRTIWPLMIMHACNDIGVNLSGYATAAKGTISPRQLFISTVLLIVITLALAIYGFFLLRTQEKSVQTENAQGCAVAKPLPKAT